jgi:hypothetical protein
MEETKPLEGELMTSPVGLMARAEIDMQIATAKQYPRPSLSVIKKKMMDFATLDEETAESCFYSLPREGKTIQGPSVRLAEITVACYGNLRVACRVLGNDGRILTSQAACHDLENNVLQSVEVQRRITNKKGQTYSDDMIVVAGNAANSIARRNAVFSTIPGVLWKPVYDQARLVAVGNASTLVTKRAKMVKRLNGMEVTTDRILARLGRVAVDDITLEDLEILIGAGTAIKDSEMSVDEAFPPVAKQGAPTTGHPTTGTPETVEQREERLKRQMDEQANAPEPVKEEPKQETPVPEGPKVVGFWPDRHAMMVAFSQLIEELGEEIVRAKLNDNGIGSDEDFGIGDKATVDCYKELVRMFDARKAAEKPAEAPRKITFGKKG